MEVAGLAVGIAGLAGLFNACTEAIEKVDSYRKFGFESGYITTHFDADKLRLQRWADDVGIIDGKLNDVHNALLDNSTVALAVGKILSIIREIFSMAESTLSRLHPQAIDDDPHSITIPGLPEEKYLVSKRVPAPTSKGNKIAWAIRGKRKLVTQVEMFGALVEKLHNLVPPGKTSEHSEFNLSRGDNLDHLLTRELSQLILGRISLTLCR